MDYGRLLNRAWEIIWEHKFLILLGILVALTSGNNGLSLSSSLNQGRTGQPWQTMRPDWEEWPWFRDMPGPGRGWAVAMPPILITLAVGFGLLVGIPLWVLSTLSRGGLIAGASAVDGGGTSSFGEAFGAAWRRGWNLIGIGALPAIPALLLALIAVVGAGAYVGLARMFGPDVVGAPRAGLGVALGVLACVLVPIAIVLGLLQTFANRACMLEDLNVIESYRRGLSVLLDNLGSAIVLFLIQIAVSIAIGILMIVPGLILVICCIFWPVLLAIQGAISAYFSTMWTLAWRRWTSAPAVEMSEA